MADEFRFVTIDELDRIPSLKSGTLHVDLATALGCVEMRPKVWYLSPGDSMRHHRQTAQEEFYFVLDGPARIRIGSDNQILDAPTGSAIRVPPSTPRQLLNDTDHEHVWLVVGAPPVEDDGRAVSA